MHTNEWNVLEYMRQVYMRTGSVPTREEVEEAFEDSYPETIEDGMREFNLLVYGRFMEKEEATHVPVNLQGQAVRQALLEQEEVV